MWAAFLNVVKGVPKSTWGVVWRFLGMLPALYDQYTAWKKNQGDKKRIDLIVKRDKLTEQMDAAIVRRDANEIARLHVELHNLNKLLSK